MYSIADKYRKETVINKENFIPKEETPQNKNKIRDSLKKVRLKYQIDDKDIPNLVNEDFNIQIIMILEVEVKSMKYIEYVNEVFQKLIKGYVIIKYICNDSVVLGYGHKRLNKKDRDEIMLLDNFVTGEYEEVFFYDSYILYEKYLDFNNIKNKANKYEFYIENMVKAYLIDKRDYIKDFEYLLKADIYYSVASTLKLYEIIKELVELDIKVKSKKTTIEKIEINKKISCLYDEREDLLNGRY